MADLTPSELMTAWREAPKDDRAGPRDQVMRYVKANADKFADLEADATRDSAVALLEAAREAGDEAEVDRIDAWIMGTYPPQRIGGVAALGGPPVPGG